MNADALRFSNIVDALKWQNTNIDNIIIANYSNNIKRIVFIGYRNINISMDRLRDKQGIDC